jgi:formate dehydrogenase subunit delta
MRRALLSYVGQDDGTLDPLVLKAMVDAPSGKNPIEKEVAGPEMIGELGSDAG